jgi:tripartite-type tricarboxylate transporter receptor subunit TctC
MFIQMVSALKLVETGRIRVLAVSQRTGLPAPIAALPLVSEVWPGFLLEGFSGFFAPVRTPAARLHELNRNLNFVLADPEVSAALRAAGQEPAGGTVQQFHEVLQRLTTRYGAVIQRLNLAYR